jgi:hypothetical protein
MFFSYIFRGVESPIVHEVCKAMAVFARSDCAIIIGKCRLIDPQIIIDILNNIIVSEMTFNKTEWYDLRT